MCVHCMHGCIHIYVFLLEAKVQYLLTQCFPNLYRKLLLGITRTHHFLSVLYTRNSARYKDVNSLWLGRSNSQVGKGIILVGEFFLVHVEGERMQALFGTSELLILLTDSFLEFRSEFRAGISIIPILYSTFKKQFAIQFPLKPLECVPSSCFMASKIIPSTCLVKLC